MALDELREEVAAYRSHRYFLYSLPCCRILFTRVTRNNSNSEYFIVSTSYLRDRLWTSGVITHTG